MFITDEMLRNVNACAGQRAHFRRLFPRGVEVTPEVAAQHAHVFNWCWAASRMLDAEGYTLFESFWIAGLKEYQRKLDELYRQNNNSDKSWSTPFDEFKRAIAMEFARLLDRYPNSRIIDMVKTSSIAV